MLTCTLKLSTKNNEDVTVAFEFAPDQLTRPSLKLSVDQAFEALKAKAIAVHLDTEPQCPNIGLKCVESIQAVIDGLNKMQGVIGETNSPISVTKLTTKSGWMILIHGA